MQVSVDFLTQSYQLIWAPLDRIEKQRFAFQTLVTLFENTRDVSDRLDTLGTRPAQGSKTDTLKFFKVAWRGVDTAARETTMVFGNLASELAGV